MGDDKNTAIAVMKAYLPNCPVCRTNSQYESVGFRKNQIRCRTCNAKWFSEELPKGPLIGLRLTEGAPFHLWDLVNVNVRIDVWQDLPSMLPLTREHWRTQYENVFKGTVVSEQGERLAMVGPFVGAYFGGRVTPSLNFSLEAQSGQLFLTNHRMIWLEGGVFKFDLPYEQLVSLQWGFTKYYNAQKEGAMVKTIDGKVNEIFQLGVLPSGFYLDANSFNILRVSIMKLVEAKKERLRDEARKNRTQIILDFSALKAELAKGGVVASTFKCPNCGKILSIPEAGKIIVCDHCGTPTKAVDLFDRLKNLLD